MLIKICSLFVLLFGVTSCQEFKCPHEYGFYPHSRSCDKYWKCENNAAELKTCGNGLAFDSADPKFLAENCDYLHNVDCGDRVDLEPAQTTKNCPRLYGIFHDEERCDTFWSCWNGEASKYTCAPGLAYDSEARVCMWADQVPGCKVSLKDGGFDCPDPKNNPNPGTFSRHAHPEDCRKYYVCLDGNAREYGCPIGTVFKIGGDEYSGQCEDPEGVDGCENYYGDELKNFKKHELLGGDNGSYKTATNKPTIRKKKIQQATQPTVVQSTKPQQQQQGSSSNQRINRPIDEQQQQQQKQQQLRPTRLQQQQQRNSPATRAPPPPPTTPAPPPPPTQTTPKKSDANKSSQSTTSADDEYYYYDNYEDVPTANNNNKKTQ